MPRNFRLARHLSLALGRSTATRELRWIKQALKQKDSSNNELASMVYQRARGMPLAYVLGNQPFGGLTLAALPPTLIPRPETEDWTMRLAGCFSPTPSSPISVLDLCTGSGCIPLLLCHVWPAGSAHALAIDASAKAVALANQNAQSCGYAELQSDNGLDRNRNTTRVRQGNLFDPSFRSFLLSQRPNGKPFHLITCNPPYIPRAEYDCLPRSVRDYEDERALLAEENGDGLTFYRQLAHLISEDVQEDGLNRLLVRGGMVVVEHGDVQSRQVQEILLGENGVLSRTEVWKDQWDKERVVVGTVG